MVSITEPPPYERPKRTASSPTVCAAYSIQWALPYGDRLLKRCLQFTRDRREGYAPKGQLEFELTTQQTGLERLGEGPVGVCALQQLLSDQLLKQGLESLFLTTVSREYTF